MGAVKVNFSETKRDFKTLEEGTWNAKLQEVTGGESKFPDRQTGEHFLEVTLVWQVTDGEDVDGNAFKGRVWDRYRLTETQAWRFAKSMTALGVELPEGDVELDEEFVDAVVEQLVENVVGQEATLTVENNEYNGKVYNNVREIEVG